MIMMEKPPPLVFNNRFQKGRDYRYSRKKYTMAMIQMVKRPQTRDEDVRKLSTRTPMLSAIAPKVRARLCFTGTSSHLISLAHYTIFRTS
jgi:hypothetical protein